MPEVCLQIDCCGTGGLSGEDCSEERAQRCTDQSAALYFGTVSGTVCGFVGSEIEITRYLAGWVELPFRETACSAPGGS